ncbi:hypothetical protein JCM10449v2_005989 [Rhodotorula kratochvilovae]
MHRLSPTYSPPENRLLRFQLDPLDYSTELGGLAPVLDLWVPLKVARKVAADLGVLDELAALLEWETRGAYSVEDKEEGGLVHNWKVGSDRITPDEYSTHALLSCTFPRIHLLPPGAQVRTLLPPLSSFPSYLESSAELAGSAAETNLNALWSRLVEWSVLAHESYLDGADEPARLAERTALPGSPVPYTPSSVDGPANLAPFFLFSTLAPLLHALDLLPSAQRSASPAAHLAPPRTLTHLHPLPALSGTSLLPPSAPSAIAANMTPDFPLHATLYLVDALARLAMYAYREQAERALEGRKDGRGRDEGRSQGEGRELDAPQDDGQSAAAVEWREGVDARLRVLEGEQASNGSPAPAPGLSTRLSAGEEADKGLKDRLARVEAQLSALQMAQRAQSQPRGMAFSSADVEVLVRAGQGKRLRTDAGVLLAVFVLGLSTGIGLVLKWR